MYTKEIVIPPFLHDVHGTKASVLDLILTYSAALISAITILIINFQNPLSLKWWSLLLLTLVAADIGAGAVANFTKSTNQFYSGNNKKRQRFIFILCHFIHPSIFFFVTNTFGVATIFLTSFVVGATFLINTINNYKTQNVVAAFLMVLGTSLVVMLKISNPFLLWMFPLYMLKLFLAFAVRREREII